MPTIEECLKVVKEINDGSSQTEEELKHKANWLYMLNRLNFWQDMPILIEIIQHEIKQKATTL